jgi:DNA-binding transcriptional ArsR family regulator
MSTLEQRQGLRFACQCVSASESIKTDPWAAIAQKKLLLDGTKEEILNVVARKPKTVAQMAKELDLSSPTVLTHVRALLESELLRESEAMERRYPAERFYEPNFPVVFAEESAQFETLCDDLAGKIADVFQKRSKQLQQIFTRTGMVKRGWEFADLTQYLYACVQRAAREELERRHALRPAQEHRNGVAWSFWAEDPNKDRKNARDKRFQRKRTV